PPSSGGSPPQPAPLVRRRGPDAAQDGGPNAEAAAQERAAAQRIQDSQRQVKDSTIDAQNQLDHIREDYSRRDEMETARGEASLEAEREKGYEQLRALKRQQEAELSKTRREGERELAQTRDYYRDTTYNEEKKGQDTLRKLQQKADLSAG